jgi:hypothetical protein
MPGYNRGMKNIIFCVCFLFVTYSTRFRSISWNPLAVIGRVICSSERKYEKENIQKTIMKQIEGSTEDIATKDTYSRQT